MTDVEVMAKSNLKSPVDGLYPTLYVFNRTVIISLLKFRASIVE